MADSPVGNSIRALLEGVDVDLRFAAAELDEARPERQAAFAAERTATLADAVSPAVQDEDRDWEATAGDGID